MAIIDNEIFFLEILSRLSDIFFLPVNAQLIELTKLINF